MKSSAGRKTPGMSTPWAIASKWRISITPFKRRISWHGIYKTFEKPGSGPAGQRIFPDLFQGPLAAITARAAYTLVACPSWEIGMHSPSLWANPKSPGPKTTAGIAAS